jgi:hypothetical protein
LARCWGEGRLQLLEKLRISNRLYGRIDGILETILDNISRGVGGFVCLHYGRGHGEGIQRSSRYVQRLDRTAGRKPQALRWL